MANERGEWWVAAQGVLLLLFILAPSVGPSWPLGLFWVLPGLLAIAAGGGLIGWGMFALGSNLTPLPRPVAGNRLITVGAYGLVRHPLYGGLLLLCFGFALLSQHWLRLLLVGVLFVFFDAKASREETWLEQIHPEYADYRQRVRKLIPFIY